MAGRQPALQHFCPFCSRAYDNSEEVTLHIRSNHRLPRRFRCCRRCNEVFEEARAAEAHQQGCERFAAHVREQRHLKIKNIISEFSHKLSQI